MNTWISNISSIQNCTGIKNNVYIYHTGFTLIELLMVMVLLITLGMIAYPRMIDFHQIQQKMMIAQIEKQMRGARLASILTGCNVLWEQTPKQIFYQLLAPCEPLKVDVNIENEIAIEAKSMIFHVVGTCETQKAIKDESAYNQKKGFYVDRSGARNTRNEHYIDCTL